MAKYLDYDGLQKVWAKIDTLFARKASIASVYKVKGSCTANVLASKTGQVEGDVWNITDESTYGPAGTNVVWVAATTTEPIVAAHWDALGGTYAKASATSDGLMSKEDFSKLAGIAENANNYVHPTSAGNKHIPSGGSTGQYLKYSASGTAVWADLPSDTDTTYTFANGTNGFTVTPKGGEAQTVTVTPSITNNALTTTSVTGTVSTSNSTTNAGSVGGTVAAPTVTITKKTVTDALGMTPQNYSTFTGASSTSAGTAGLVIAPAIGDQTKFLKGDGSWEAPTFDIPSGSSTVIGGVKTGAELTSTDGYTAVGIKNNVIYYKDTNTTYDVFTGASKPSGGSFSAGSTGLVPAPSTDGDQAKYLRGDGVWATPSNTDTKVTQTVTTSGTTTYPILFTNEANKTATSTTTTRFCTAITAAPNGTLTATTFVGALTGNASSATKLGSTTVGGTTTPIYLNEGVPTALSYTIAKSVPSDAKFTDTDTTYTFATSTGTNWALAVTPKGGSATAYAVKTVNMGAATASAAGTAGLVSAPAGSQTKYLRGDATWQVVADTAITETEINTICV